MLSPLPRRSDWAHCFAHFTHPCQPSPIWQSGRPAHCPFRGSLGVHSRNGLHTRAVTVFRDTLSEGFSHFVTSIAAPVASGWSGCRVGFAPTGKRRLFTAHGQSGLWEVVRPSAFMSCAVILARAVADLEARCERRSNGTLPPRTERHTANIEERRGYSSTSRSSALRRSTSPLAQAATCLNDLDHRLSAWLSSAALRNSSTKTLIFSV